MNAREQEVREMEEALAGIPVIDIHTHLVGGRLGARGLHDLLLYHMVVSDLYSAGCPTGRRLTEFPHWPDQKEAARRIEEAIPYLPAIRNTSSHGLLRRLLADLYGWNDPITAENWRRLDALVRERADDRAWHHACLDRMRVARTGTEIARRGAGEDDGRLQYALEWGFFTRCQWGEYDTALYELERCWGKTPESPSPIGAGGRAPADRTIRSLEDVHAALAWYVGAIPGNQVLSMATHLSTDLEYRRVGEAEMEAALKRRDQAGPEERNIYASYVQEAFLTALERTGGRLVYQFSLGAEPLPHETASRLRQSTLAQLGEMIAAHPRLQFQCFLASRHANQTLCTFCRELPNFSLAGYWWHNFFPSIIRPVMEERFDMLPANRQIGFFSDAYCVEWAWAKLFLVRRLMAEAFCDRIERGAWNREEALQFARAILVDSARQLLGFQPRAGAGVE